MNKYIFLKTSHSDERLTEQLTKELEAAGHKVWLGQSAEAGAVTSGDQQQRQTEFAIERSDAFILGLSPEMSAEDGVAQELAVAQAADKPIFLVKLRPGSLPADWATLLSGRPLVDLSVDFDAGLERLLAVLSGGEGGAEGEGQTELVLGGDYYDEIPALPGEEELWSEAGYYWFKKWKTLVRILALQTNRRLIFFWDSRDIWKWKPREADELEVSFPMALSLDEISTIGDIFQPKSFLIFSSAKPYVEIEVGQNQRHRFSLQSDFEAHIDTLRDAVSD